MDYQKKLIPVIEEIKKGKRFIVVCHVNSEGDALGSLLGLALSLRDAGKEVIPYLEDELPELYGFLPGSDLITHTLEGVGDVDATLAVDCGQIERLGDKFTAFKGRGTLINLDHHVSNSNFGDINVVLPEASAAGEIVYDLLKAAGLPISRDVAMNLYVAIHTDTGSFRYSSATAEAFRKAGDLVELGADPWEMSKRVYESYPEKRFMLLGKVLSTLKTTHSGRVAVLSLTGDMLRSVNGDRELADGFVNYARAIDGVEVGVFLREAGEGRFKVSLRSKGSVDVSKVASLFGGGGHRNAAGFNIDGAEDEVRGKLMDAITEGLEECA